MFKLLAWKKTELITLKKDYKVFMRNQLLFLFCKELNDPRKKQRAVWNDNRLIKSETLLKECLHIVWVDWLLINTVTSVVKKKQPTFVITKHLSTNDSNDGEPFFFKKKSLWCQLSPNGKDIHISSGIYFFTYYFLEYYSIL